MVGPCLLSSPGAIHAKLWRGVSLWLEWWMVGAQNSGTDVRIRTCEFEMRITWSGNDHVKITWKGNDVLCFWKNYLMLFFLYLLFFYFYFSLFTHWWKRNEQNSHYFILREKLDGLASLDWKIYWRIITWQQGEEKKHQQASMEERDKHRVLLEDKPWSSEF